MKEHSKASLAQSKKRPGRDYVRTTKGDHQNTEPLTGWMLAKRKPSVASTLDINPSALGLRQVSAGRAVIFTNEQGDI